MRGEVRALRRDDREVVHRKPLVTAVESEDLADDPEFEGMRTVEQGDSHVLQHGAQSATSMAVIRCCTAVLPLSGVSSAYDDYRMDALLGTLTVTVLFLLLAAPALMGLVHERRIDRQLRAARPTQKSSSRSTVPSTATWYAEGRRSKKLVSS